MARNATPLSPPSTTALLNLSDYMYQAYDTAYASTTLQSNIGFTPLTTRNGAPAVSIDNATGLYAQAFVSTAPGPKQVVIAYEGTQLSPSIPLGDIPLPNLFSQGKTFSAAQIVDDLQLYAGQKADSFTGSASFARDVAAIAAKQGIAKRNITVTGHSLGAAEAEFAAAKTGLSGVTFAGPGINTAYTGRHGGDVTNYVDAGDPIGNYAADGLNTLAPILTNGNIKHFGSVVVLPNADGLSSLQGDVTTYEMGDPTDQSEAIYSAILGNGQYHHLTNYASDLGVTLYVNGDGSSGGQAQGNVDMSYVAASMTGNGALQSSGAGSSTGHASVLAASSDTLAHAMGVKPHHAG